MAAEAEASIAAVGFPIVNVQFQYKGIGEESCRWQVPMAIVVNGAPFASENQGEWVGNKWASLSIIRH